MASPEVAVILPTYNERQNIPLVIAALRCVLSRYDYEVIIVDDDSEDGTASRSWRLAEDDSRIRVIRRINRAGLASACVEGMMATRAPFLAVMDADLQHDESILPAMFDKIREGGLDLVVATRRSEGGSMGEFSWPRKVLSWLGGVIGNVLLGPNHVSDPMSGYFVVSRSFLEEVVRRLNPRGFKILLDMLATANRPLAIAEMGYRFRQRVHGASKLNAGVMIEYVELIVDKLVGDYLPPSYVMFGCVGAIGVIIHLLVVRLVIQASNVTVLEAQGLASSAAMVGNYWLNNRITFRRARLRGSRWFTGLFLFCAACSIGLFVNIASVGLLMNIGMRWYVATAAGISLGSVWNYGVSSVLVWGIQRRRSVARSLATCRPSMEDV